MVHCIVYLLHNKRKKEKKISVEYVIIYEYVEYLQCLLICIEKYENMEIGVVYHVSILVSISFGGFLCIKKLSRVRLVVATNRTLTC